MSVYILEGVCGLGVCVCARAERVMLNKKRRDDGHLRSRKNRTTFPYDGIAERIIEKKVFYFQLLAVFSTDFFFWHF